MDINRLKRMAIGPLALIFIGLVCAGNYKPDPRHLPPLHLQDLKVGDTTVSLSERGRYVFYYAFPLDINVKSNPFDVAASLDNSSQIGKLIDEIDKTKVEVKDTEGNPLTEGKTTDRLLYRAGEPLKWIAGRPVFAFTNLRPNKFQIHIEENENLKDAKGQFKVGSLTRPESTSGYQFLLSTFAIPAGMLVYLWAILAATPWGFLADRYQKDCDLTKLKSAGKDATVGRVKMAMIPTQKMMFLETTEGIHLAISGLARHLGFTPIFIPWSKFTDAIRKGEFLDLKVSEPKTTISLRANLLIDAEKCIRSDGGGRQQPDGVLEASITDETEVSSAPTIEAEPQLFPAEPLPRSQRAGLGLGLIMMGLVLGKFFVYDTLQAAHAKMAKVSVFDGIVCFAPFSIVVGIMILAHTLTNKTPDTTIPTGKRGFFWQMVGFAIALPILGFWFWFRWELTKLGYPFLRF
ncbi:MAG: hypothetical protein IT343_16530 [Candidatus Melainabacteria bacterium]|nr:hypothetical protein [Candidatus Melainabacteria bacterium]